jgi:hypothetical protein
MFYEHLEDIDPNIDISAAELDILLRNAINRCSIELRTVTVLSSEAKNLLADLLLAFGITHRSIRLLIDQYETAMELSSDAMSLAREQVEKIFVLALLADDPAKWVTSYIKSGWRKRYERFLLDKKESQNLPEHSDFFTNLGSKLIEESRIICGVSKDEMLATELKYYDPSKSLPQNLNGCEIAEFPTPGKAKGKVKNLTLKKALDRWYLEYRFLCGYSHIGTEKLLAQSLTNRRFEFGLSQREEFFQKNLASALVISSVAAAFACTEIYGFVSHNIEITGELTKLWDEVEKKSLLGKAFWNLHAKEILSAMF